MCVQTTRVRLHFRYSELWVFSCPQVSTGFVVFTLVEESFLSILVTNVQTPSKRYFYTLFKILYLIRCLPHSVVPLFFLSYLKKDRSVWFFFLILCCPEVYRDLLVIGYWVFGGLVDVLWKVVFRLLCISPGNRRWPDFLTSDDFQSQVHPVLMFVSVD